MLQVAVEMSMSSPVLYASGEESVRQIKMRAERLRGSNNQSTGQLFLVTETNLDAILAHAQEVKPALLIVDSIQTTFMDGLSSSAGSVSQVRECASRLRQYAKESGTAVFLIGHVTKEGMIAGPRVLEHIVDTVLQLEGDRFQSYRLLRSMKNRFGPTSEVGVFEMREQGMAEVPNPSEAFLAERMADAPGSSIAVTMGARARFWLNFRADQPHQLWQSTPHHQRAGFQPPAAGYRGAHPPAGTQPLQSGCVF